MKPYNSIQILLTLKKHLWLFIFLLIVSSAITLFWANSQITLINTKIAESNAKNTEILSNQNLDYTRNICIRIDKYHAINLPDYILNPIFKGFENPIAFKKIINNSFFDIWQFKFEQTPSQAEILAIVEAINYHPLSVILRQEPIGDNNPLLERIRNHGFASLIPNTICADFTAQQNNLNPTNKHFIYLDKDRIASQKGYLISSTQIISAHASLNSNKIYVFALLCAIMISLFVVFSVESIKSMIKQMK